MTPALTMAARIILTWATTLALAACGGGGGGGSGGTPTSAITPTPTPAPTIAAATLVTSVAPATYDPSTPAAGVYAQINKIRAACGFGLVAQSTSLDQAGFDHAQYAAFSNDPNRVSHTENPAYTYFTGATPADRIAYRGYPDTGGGEILGGSGFQGAPSAQTGADYINGMLTTVYHGNLVLAPYLAVGSGSAVNTSISVIISTEFGDGPNATGQMLAGDTVAFYPCDGMKGISPTFYKGEQPAPFPDSAYTPATNSHYTGFPARGASIFVKVRGDQALVVTTLSLTDAAGNDVPGRMLNASNDPNHDIPASTIVFSPNLELKENTMYTLHVVGTNNGIMFDKKIHFTTGTA